MIKFYLCFRCILTRDKNSIHLSDRSLSSRSRHVCKDATGETGVIPEINPEILEMIPGTVGKDQLNIIKQGELLISDTDKDAGVPAGKIQSKIHSSQN